MTIFVAQACIADQANDVSADQYKIDNGDKKSADIKTIVSTPDGLVVKAIGFYG